MTAELQKKLIEKYPDFFKYLEKYEGPIMPIQFGFECGDGWYWLLDNLMEDIDSYVKNNQKRERVKNKFLRWFVDLNLNRLNYRQAKPFYKLRHYILDHAKTETYDRFGDVYITQIKEKFGTLRFYYNGGNDMISGMVWLAESLSATICEECGSTKNAKTINHYGWLYTRCEECKKTL